MFQQMDIMVSSMHLEIESIQKIDLMYSKWLERRKVEIIQIYIYIYISTLQIWNIQHAGSIERVYILSVLYLFLALLLLPPVLK